MFVVSVKGTFVKSDLTSNEAMTKLGGRLSVLRSFTKSVEFFMV